MLYLKAHLPILKRAVLDLSWPTDETPVCGMKNAFFWVFLKKGLLSLINVFRFSSPTTKLILHLNSSGDHFGHGKLPDSLLSIYRFSTVKSWRRSQCLPENLTRQSGAPTGVIP